MFDSVLRWAGIRPWAAIQAMPITTDGCPRLSAAGAIDVTNKTLIKFDGDADGLHMNEGTTKDTTNYHTLSSGEPYTFDEGVTSIYVDGAVGYLLK